MRGAVVTTLTGVLAATTADGQGSQLMPAGDTARFRIAASHAPAVRWRIPIGAALIEEMKAVHGDRLLIALREDGQSVAGREVMLVGAADGTVRWRRRSPERGEVTLSAITDDALLLHLRPGNDEIVLVDLETGTDRWRIRAGAADVQMLPYLERDRIVTARRARGALQLTGYDAARGRETWTHKVESDSGALSPLGEDAGVLLVNRAITLLDPGTGKPVWSHPCHRRPSDPPPAVQANVIWTICDSALVAIDLANGEPRQPIALDAFLDVSSVYADESTVLVRGFASPKGRREAAGAGAFLIAAFDPVTATRRWMLRTAQPTVSNAVTTRGRLFLATPRTLIAFDSATGELAFSHDLDETGRAYPVRLRAYPDRVVFLGELVVAGVGADSGGVLYRYGMTPISQEASLTQLDAQIQRIEAQVAGFAKQPNTSMPSAGSIAVAEVNRYQQMSRYWASQEQFYKSSGNQSMRDFSAGQSRRAEAQADRMNKIAIAASLIEIGLHFYFAHKRRSAEAVWEGFLRREMFFRRGIVASNSLGIAGDYVVRPEQTFDLAGGVFTSVNVIHLPTGHRRRTLVGPSYQSYGLWVNLDPSSGSVVTQSISLNPADWQWSEPRDLYSHKGARTIMTDLVALPVVMPAGR